MEARQEFVRQIYQLAFDAISALSIPEDATPEEQAEGLVSLAVAVLKQIRAGRGCEPLRLDADKRKYDQLLMTK